MYYINQSMFSWLLLDNQPIHMLFQPVHVLYQPIHVFLITGWWWFSRRGNFLGKCRRGIHCGRTTISAKSLCNSKLRLYNLCGTLVATWDISWSKCKQTAPGQYAQATPCVKYSLPIQGPRLAKYVWGKFFDDFFVKFLCFTVSQM